MWAFACDREIATLPGYAKIFIPGPATVDDAKR